MKVATILLLVMLMPISPVWAEPNAPVPAAPKVTVLAAPKVLGRLFFTPEQRARMDVARQQARSVNLDQEEKVVEAAPETVTLNGIITRSDGQAMVWINGHLKAREDAPSPVIVQGRERQVGIVSPDGRSQTPLKVGQSIDTGSGKVDEAWLRVAPGAQADSAESRKNDHPVPR